MRAGLNLFSVAVLVAIAGRSGAQEQSARALRLTLLDGTARPTELSQIERGVLVGRGIEDELTLDDVQRIEWPGAMKPLEEPAAIIELYGGRLLAKSVSVAEEKCVVTWLDSQETAILLDGVRAIRFAVSGSNAEFEKAVATPNAELDRAFMRDEAGTVTGVTGLIESLDEQRLKMDISGQARELPREKLLGLIIAQPAAIDKPAPYAVLLRDGSKLASDSISLNDGVVELRLPKANLLSIPWTLVSRIDVRSSRVQFLSELKPIAEQQQPLVTLGLAARRDLSAAGGPLVLADRTYEKGLGVHARSALTFATEGKWDRFSATIGLDPERGGKGDCIFKVLADEEEVFSKRLRGVDSPVEINLGISGRQKLTLAVEPGEGLDLADHANWCDARLIKHE